jgi:N-acyl-D-aspartate/D-glutamate deacylase
LLAVAVLAAVVVGGYMVWSLFGKEAAPGVKPGQAAESGNGNGQQGSGSAGESGTGESDEGKAGSGDGNTSDKPAADLEADVTQADLDKTYDVVISGGRVINPETKLDQEDLNVGISGGTIGVVTSKPLKGSQVIDAKGLVVAPGFIDNLSYDPNPLGVWNKIADGVTSNIAMHGGTINPAIWYDHYERDKPPVNFGASFFSMQARNQFKLSRYDKASPAQIAKMKKQAEKALNDGALGISFSLEYAPGTSSAEVLALMEVAKKYNVPVYFHGRYSDVQEPGTETDTMTELVGYARASGAAVHIDHINSTGGTFSMTEALAMIDKARAEGLDITACTYAYDYWGTYLNSARFDEGWQDRFRIGYNDLQIAGTDERLNPDSFRKYQKQGKLAVAYAIPSEAVIEAFRAPYVMIGSDAILEPGNNNHPRASGNFARAIGLYVREQNVVPLMDMIGKLSLMPAQRLELQAPALKKKGRIAKGMDADIVVFDYNTINDASTVAHPEFASKGIEYVLVQGKLVLEHGKINKKTRLGESIRSHFERVKEASGTLQWNGAAYPLVVYNQQQYVDLTALTKQGYGIKWEKVTHTFTAAKKTADDGSAASDPAKSPDKGELMLERGFKVAVDGVNAELLSIGSRAYVPLSFLKELGFDVHNDDDSWTIDA